jgi:phosphopantothenoylcysteine decarboxylase/phosphopantothenate--cysteine ligase
VLVGFALETSRGLPNARAKLEVKGVDLMVLNTPAAGLGGDTNRVTLVEARTAKKLPEMSKREVAEAILDRAIALRPAAPKRAAGAGRAVRPAAGRKRR